MLVPTSSLINANGGFICLSTHWQPDANSLIPDIPGRKYVMSSFIALRLEDACLCGSEKIYAICCQPKRYWHPICPNPDMNGYSLVAPQTAKFYSVEGTELRKQLLKDTRLHCVENSVKRSFWTYWGEPALKDQYGVLCFGDFELKENNLLIVTAMSELRMNVLLGVLKEITHNKLCDAEITYDKTDEFIIDKRLFRQREKKIKSNKKSKHRRR